MVSVKQGGIKYHVQSLWCNSTWDWTQVSQTIGEHSTHSANGLIIISSNIKPDNYVWIISILYKEYLQPNNCGENYNYCILLEFFTPAFVGGLSQESEWQQVSSGVQDSPEYSHRSQQCCSLNSLDSSTDFQFLQSFLALGNRSDGTNNNWYFLDFYIPQFFFLLLWQGPCICFSFLFLLLSYGGPLEWQNPHDGKCAFLCQLTISLFFLLNKNNSHGNSIYDIIPLLKNVRICCKLRQ